MKTTARGADETVLRDGNLVEFLRQRRVVSDSSPGSDGSTLLTLQSVENGRNGKSLPVVCQVAPFDRVSETTD